MRDSTFKNSFCTCVSQKVSVTHLQSIKVPAVVKQFWCEFPTSETGELVKALGAVSSGIVWVDTR